MSLYIGLAFFVVLILILAIPFRIILDYRLKQGEDLLSVEVFWLGFRLVHGFIPVFWTAESEPEAGLGENEGGANYTIDVQARETPSVPGDIGAIINALARCYHFIFDAAHVILRGDYPPSNRHSPLYRWALYHFSQDAARLGRQVEKLKWSTTLGLGDAAATAILAGALLGLKAAGFAWLQQKLQIGPTKLHWQVLPHYGGLWLEVHIHCILRVNTGHIIITGIVDAFRSRFQKAAGRRKQLAAVEE